MIDNASDSPQWHPHRKRFPTDRDTSARRPLRDVVCDIDRDILRQLLRRANLLTKMRGSAPRLEAGEERYLRESWETAASRVCRDSRLYRHFFSLMQEMTFLPRPTTDNGNDVGTAIPSQQQTAFNLAPAQKAVRLQYAAPLSCRMSRAWLMLAALSGQPLRLAPCLMNDPLLDCIQMLNQAGAKITREHDGVIARPAAPLGAPDKVLHVGDSVWNFYLLLGHYLGRPSHAKITGGTELKLADFSAVRHVLPSLGARLVPVVPRSEGLPVRLECSGILPDIFALPAQVPAAFAEGVLLAAHGYEKPLTLDLTAHPDREDILARTLPLLQTAGSTLQQEDWLLHIEPRTLQIPEQPDIPLEPTLALFLLTLPLALGGECRLTGSWSTLPDAQAALDVLRQAGLELHLDAGSITSHCATPPHDLPCLELPEAFPTAWLPLPLALIACVALRGGTASLPRFPQDADIATVESFLRAAGVTRKKDDQTLTRTQEEQASAWNAPDALWALALAVAACGGPGRKLGNPGIMTTLYPMFWSLYNTLPEPTLRPSSLEEPQTAPTRRRILTDAVATVPPENWDTDA